MQQTCKQLKQLCDAQVDIPHAARSALDILRSQRLQKHSSRPAVPFSPTGGPPPLQDTLPLSESPRDPFQAKDSSPVRDPLQPSHVDMPPMDNTLPPSALDSRNRVLESEPGMPPLDDTAVDSRTTGDIQSTECASPLGTEAGGKTVLHEVCGMRADQAGNGHEEVGDDELLLKQAVAEELLGAGRSSPAPVQDDDDEALLHSLIDEEARALNC